MLEKIIAEMLVKGIKKEVVGTVSPELLTRLQDKRKTEKELEANYEKACKEALENVAETYKSEWDKADSVHKAVWSDIYEELQLNPEDGYSVDNETGEIFRKVKFEVNGWDKCHGQEESTEEGESVDMSVNE